MGYPISTRKGQDGKDGKDGRRGKRVKGVNKDIKNIKRVKHIRQTICALSKRQIQLCAFMIRGGKKITPVRFCGYASPKLTRFSCLPNIHLNIGRMATRHAEIGAINALSEKAKQMRYLKKTTLVVIRFIEPPPKQKYKDKISRKRAKKKKYISSVSPSPPMSSLRIIKIDSQSLPSSPSPSSPRDSLIDNINGINGIDDIDDNCSIISGSSLSCESKESKVDNDCEGAEEEEDESESELSLELACSRPCSECLRILRALKLKSVIYVNEEGDLVNENPDNISNSVFSGGTIGMLQNR